MCQNCEGQCLIPWGCKDIKGIVAPEIGPKRFGTSEKQAPGHKVQGGGECTLILRVGAGNILTISQ